MKELSFSRCDINKESLDKYRDEMNFIDIDQLRIEFSDNSRNQIGSSDIFKYWVDFDGTKALLKQEKLLDGEPNGTLYSELIMHELCDRVGIESANVDVFKTKDFRGLISYMAYDNEKENMMMTRELIGDIASDGDTYDFETVEEKIKEELVRQFSISEHDAEKIIFERRLQKILQLYSAEMDNHLENEGFLFSTDDEGNYRVRLCPMFDNELSFGLHANFSEMMQDSLYDSLETKIGILRHELVNMKERRHISSKGMKALRDISSEKELSDTLLGNIQLRNRIAGNGKQVVLDDNKTPKYYSKADATLAYLYNQSSEIVENFENYDDEKVELNEQILDLISSLRSIDMEEVISKVAETVKIPSTVKTQLRRFSNVKEETLYFVENGSEGEVAFYNKKAQIMLKEREKQENNKKPDMDI